MNLAELNPGFKHDRIIRLTRWDSGLELRVEGLHPCDQTEPYGLNSNRVEYWRGLVGYKSKLTANALISAANYWWNEGYAEWMKGAEPALRKAREQSNKKPTFTPLGSDGAEHGIRTWYVGMDWE